MRTSPFFFRPDDGAKYAQIFEIDLGIVTPSVALYPSPDNVAPITEVAKLKLDGCFIGACTTTEEDLVLAGLVLKAGLARGLPLAAGTRHVTPGSLPIVDRLQQLDLLDVYESAGFTRGAPGCSYCVGVVDVAPSGSVWLSSQNRNFQDRMGKGTTPRLRYHNMRCAQARCFRFHWPFGICDSSRSLVFRNGNHRPNCAAPRH